MYFPVVSHSPIRVKSAHLDETAPLQPGANETILVVDDEAAIRQLVSEFLTETGYHVLDALDSVSALKQADKTENRSEERRVGKEGGRKGRSGGAQSH